MSQYGKTVTKKIVCWLINKNVKIITGRVKGVNDWVIKCGKEKVEVVKTTDFEQMNLEIARKCDKLVVIEGGKNSGTFLVAQAVLEMKKEVWAIPGRIVDENSFAPNWLISNGGRILFDIESELVAGIENNCQNRRLGNI